MNAERELVDVGLLATEIEDANLGVGDTTVEARLRVRLLSITVSGMFSLVVVVLFSSPHAPIPPSFALQSFQWVSSVCGGRQNISYLVLAVAVTSRGTTGHFDGISVVDLAWVRQGWKRRGRRYQGRSLALPSQIALKCEVGRREARANQGARKVRREGTNQPKVREG